MREYENARMQECENATKHHPEPGKGVNTLGEWMKVRLATLRDGGGPWWEVEGEGGGKGWRVRGLVGIEDRDRDVIGMWMR
jgi:hypothetical protein